MIDNCKIRSTMLGYEDHGILTSFLYLEGSGWGVGFGGYSLDEWSVADNKRIPSQDALGKWISGILEVLELEKWEDLPGTFIRADHSGPGGKCERIGHLLKNQWFDPRDTLG